MQNDIYQDLWKHMAEAEHHLNAAKNLLNAETRNSDGWITVKRASQTYGIPESRIRTGVKKGIISSRKDKGRTRDDTTYVKADEVTKLKSMSHGQLSIYEAKPKANDIPAGLFSAMDIEKRTGVPAENIRKAAERKQIAIAHTAHRKTGSGTLLYFDMAHVIEAMKIKSRLNDTHKMPLIDTTHAAVKCWMTQHEFRKSIILHDDLKLESAVEYDTGLRVRRLYCEREVIAWRQAWDKRRAATGNA